MSARIGGARGGRSSCMRLSSIAGSTQGRELVLGWLLDWFIWVPVESFYQKIDVVREILVAKFTEVSKRCVMWREMLSMYGVAMWTWVCDVNIVI